MTSLSDPRNLAITICLVCGKRCYLTRKDAKRAARALHPHTALRAYPCGQFWHVGNTPPWRKHGEAPPWQRKRGGQTS